MKKLVLFTVALLALSASLALAATGTNLSWSGCTTGGTSVAFSTNTCDGAFGSSKKIQASFRTSAAVTQFGAVQALVDITGADLSYWDISTGGCSDGAMSLGGPGTSATLCPTQLFAPATSSGGFNVAMSPGRVRMNIIYAAAPAVPPSCTAGQLYGAFALAIDPDFGFAAGCAGCQQPVVFTLQCLQVQGFGTGDTQDVCTQDVQQCVGYAANPGNCGATATHNSTWGAVKALYR